MGWDKHYGFQLYQSDPSGNYGGWKATCIGNNSAVSVAWGLQNDYLKQIELDRKTVDVASEYLDFQFVENCQTNTDRNTAEVQSFKGA